MHKANRQASFFSCCKLQIVIFIILIYNNKTNSDFRCSLITSKPLNPMGQMGYHANPLLLLSNVSHGQMKCDPLDQHQGSKTFTALLCTFYLICCALAEFANFLVKNFAHFLIFLFLLGEYFRAKTGSWTSSIGIKCVLCTTKTLQVICLQDALKK